MKVIPSFIKIVPRDLELKHAEVDTISPVRPMCLVLDTCSRHFIRVTVGYDWCALDS
jgi:hypothetical protein